MSEAMANLLTSEPLSYLSTPAISVDRALGHFFPDVILSPAHMTIFYYSLPHEDKPPLNNLSIHFTSSPLQSGEGDNAITTYGTMLWDGTSSDKLATTPELPKTTNPTIIIYVGSELLHQEGTCALNANLNEYITHELTHYAQGEPNDSRPSRLQRAKNQVGALAMGTLYGLVTDGRWLKSGTATLVASEILTSNSATTSVKVAAGAASIIHLAGNRDRAKRRSQKSHKRYLERETESDARAHEDPASGIVTLAASDADLSILSTITINRQKHARATRFIARQRHKELSLNPTSRKNNL